MNLQQAASNLRKSLTVLQEADYQRAKEDKLHRSGIIAEFARTFELAWKAIQAALEPSEAERIVRGSPRSIIRAGYAAGLIADQDLWLRMLEDRNSAFHRYDEGIDDNLLRNVIVDYLPALEEVSAVLTSLATDQ